jgi:two-component system phosphate regulon response regulator PhoB
MGTVAVHPNRSTRLLVASGDPGVRAGVREALVPLPCDVEEVSSAHEAVAAAERERPDLLISDMVLRDATGIALIRLVREHPRLSALPVVLLSTFKEEMDRILAFEAGVDDFITAPYYRRELLSRARAILRRAQATSELPATRAAEGPVRLDLDGARVEIFGERIDLTPKEFRIFAVLVRNDRRVLSRERIIDEVWDGAVADPRAVDAHIKVIRRKLGPLANAIQTVRGVGFRFRPPEADRDGRKRSEGDSPSLRCA